MKHTNCCPKCGSRDVAVVQPALYNSFPAGVFKQAKLERWVCCACGYSEEWVEASALEAVRNWWKGSEKMAEDPFAEKNENTPQF